MLKGTKIKGMVACLALSTLLTGCGFFGLGEKSDQIGVGTEGSNSSGAATETTLSPLTGLAIEKETLKRRPLAVMINNSTSARPQSGLDKADMVYEFLAEGGITRLLAIYIHNDVEEVGPVRSARPYFVVKALEFDALYAHCGGSTDALEDIKRYNVADLDEFTIGKKAFWRSSDRVAPHNLYTSTDNLWTYANTKKLNTPVNLPGFKFLAKGEDTLGQRAENIFIKYSSKNYNVTYKFNAASKTYLRFNGDAAHVDKVSGKQLEASNILIQYAPTLAHDDSRLDIDLMGEGKALLFNNGKVQNGSWKKNSLNEQTVFLDETGNEVKLVPGQTWIQVVPTTSEVTY